MDRSAFGVVHKSVTDRDDPMTRAPVRGKPAAVDTAKIQAKLRGALRPLAREAKRVR